MVHDAKSRYHEDLQLVFETFFDMV